MEDGDGLVEGLFLEEGLGCVWAWDDEGGLGKEEFEGCVGRGRFYGEGFEVEVFVYGFEG